MLPFPDASPKIYISKHQHKIDKCLIFKEAVTAQRYQWAFSSHHTRALFCTFYFSSTDRATEIKDIKRFNHPRPHSLFTQVLTSCSVLQTKAPFCSINTFPIASPFLQNNSSASRWTDVCYYHFSCHMSPGKRSRYIMFVAIGITIFFFLCTFHRTGSLQRVCWSFSLGIERRIRRDTRAI